MAQLWRLVDPSNLTDTVPTWLDASVRLVQSQHAASALVARRYFRAFRVAEFGAALPGTLATPAFVREAVVTSLMVTGPVRIERARRQGLDVGRATTVALAETARAAQMHSLRGGRDQLMSAVESDPRAIGHVRVTSGNSCAFCALLAGRGAVYLSEDSADFDAHPGCSCHGEAVYSTTQALPASSERYAELYAEAARGESDQLNAFRRAYEGRDA
jgi:post-segregation antitoxin (ccd killing protein)